MDSTLVQLAGGWNPVLREVPMGGLVPWGRGYFVRMEGAGCRPKPVAERLLRPILAHLLPGRDGQM